LSVLHAFKCLFVHCTYWSY